MSPQHGETAAAAGQNITLEEARERFIRGPAKVSRSISGVVPIDLAQSKI
jgi:hypothetical protein